MIKSSISIILISPKSLLKDQINSGNSTTLLILEDHFFSLWNSSNLNLIDYSNGYWEKYIFTYVNFLWSLNIYLNLFTWTVLNLDNWTIHHQYILFFQFGSMDSSLFYQFMAHMLWESYHTILDSHSIYCVLNFTGIVFNELETTIILKELHHTNFISTHAL